MGLIDWQQSAQSLANLIRGLNPAPGCYTNLAEKRLKIWQAKVYSGTDIASSPKTIGEIVGVFKQSFVVTTGEGLLEILEVQPENKKRMQAGDFIRGHQLKVGTILG